MSDVAAAYLPIGAVLKNRYEIVREIGRGGYSVVFAARDRELDTEVAVKLLVPPPAVAHIARERMRREVQVVRGLAHERIVAVHDFLEDGPPPRSFIIMELVDGPNLAAHVARRYRLAVEDVIRLGRDIAAALAFAHERGVLHRDVKPQNILLDTSGHALLTDFGSAKLDGQLTVTQTGGLVGTVPYTAPEVLLGQRGDARADIYALGMTLFFALCGRLPGETPRLPPPAAPAGHRPSHVRDDVPEWLDHVIARSTSSDPSRRFHAAGDLVAALERREHAGPLVPPPATGADFCFACGETDTYGMTPCPTCRGRGLPARSRDTLVFALAASKRKDRLDLALKIGALFTEPVTARALRDAARGRRALVRIPAGRAAEVVRRLASLEIPAQAVPKSQTWAALPLPLYGLAAAIVVVGSLAGLLVTPLLVWTSPLVAGLLVLGGHRGAQDPLLKVRKRQRLFPAPLETRVSDTMADLEPGTTAKRLVADIVTVAQSALEHAAPGDEHPWREQLVDLVANACEVSKDLANLDQALALLERHRERFASRPEAWVDALSQCEQARDRLVQQLLDVLSVLGRIEAHGASGDLSAEQDLARLTRNLEHEVERRIEAEAEIEALLAAVPA